MKKICLSILAIVCPSVTRSLSLLEKQILALIDSAELLVGDLIVVLLSLGNEFLVSNQVN